MTKDQESDSFQGQLATLGIELVNGIAPGDIRNIIRNIDCIKYNKEFISFIKMHWSDIFMEEEVMLSVMRIFIAIGDICKSDLGGPIRIIAKEYESNISKRPIKDIDISIIFSFIRSFMESKIPIRRCILLLVTRISLLDGPDEISDACDIVVNNYDVLESIYKNDEIANYGYALDSIINETFGQLLTSASTS